MAEFTGFHALITGASRGIGYAIAKAFVEKGANVTICGKDEARLFAAKNTLNTANALCFDVTNEAEMVKAVADLPPVHFLINNAGNAFSAPFLKTTSQDLNAMLALNLTAPYLLTQAILPKMVLEAKSKRGRIVNIASTAGLIGYPYVSAYVSAKHGLIGLTKALALELAGKNITVNAIAPTYTNTPMIESALATMRLKTGRTEAESQALLVNGNPMKRLLQPHEVANAACFLCSEGSDMVNGHTLTIDGGEVIQ